MITDSSLQTDNGTVRRGSAISFHSPYHSRRRQTFHYQGSLLPTSFAVSGFPSIYTTDQENVSNKNAVKDSTKLDNALDNQKHLRRMSSIDYKRRSSLSASNSRRGSLFRPRAELQALIGLSKSAGLMPCPTTKQLLSLTELVIDEKERDKRILRKALSMENRTGSEDITLDYSNSGVLMVPSPYSSDKMLLRLPEDDKFKKSERRPLFRQQKSTEAMEKIEESFGEQNPTSTKSASLHEKRKSISKQISLDNKPSQMERSKEINAEEIALVVQERRTPYIRELRSQTHDFSLDETPFAFTKQENEHRAQIRRQMTTPTISDESPIRKRKHNLVRQNRQEIISSESLTKNSSKDNLPMSVLEKRDLLIRKSEQSSEDVETAETSLSAKETSSSMEKKHEDTIKKTKAPHIKKGKLLEASIETSTSSNSTTVTNVRSDSIISEDVEKDFKTDSKLLKSDDSKSDFDVFEKGKIIDDDNDDGNTNKTGSKELLLDESRNFPYDLTRNDSYKKKETEQKH